MIRRAAPAQMKRAATLGISSSDEAREANCVGKAKKFDSPELADHLEIRHLCETCPVVAWCDAEFKSAFRESRGCGGHAGPQGTWAGRLYSIKSVEIRVRTCRGCRRLMVPGRRYDAPAHVVVHSSHGYCNTCDTARRSAAMKEAS